MTPPPPSSPNAYLIRLSSYTFFCHIINQFPLYIILPPQENKNKNKKIMFP